MGILNVDNIQPVGGGTTITLNSSEINVGTGVTFESNGQANFAGIVTATSFVGSGANLTGLTASFFEKTDVGINTISKVGIGTTNPTAKLEIKGSNNPLVKIVQDTSGIARLNLESATNDGYQYSGIGLGDGTNDAELMWTTGGFDINVGNAVRLRINSSGAWGAGTNFGSAGQVLTSQGSGSPVQWATPSGAMTLLHTMNINMTANTQSQSLNLTGYQKLMGTITSLSRSGGVNDSWLTFNGDNSSGAYSWVRSYLDNSNDTSTNRSGTSTGYAYGSVGPGFFINLAGIAAADSGNIDAEFTVHNLQDGGRKIFTMTSRSFLVRNIVIDTRGSINTTSAITSIALNVSNAVSRNTGGTIKLYGFK